MGGRLHRRRLTPSRLSESHRAVEANPDSIGRSDQSSSSAARMRHSGRVGDRQYAQQANDDAKLSGVANTESIMRFPQEASDTESSAPGANVIDLPARSINHHWTKNIIASRDGSRLEVTVGSNSNIGENGMANEVNRAALLDVNDLCRTTKLRLYAIEHVSRPCSAFRQAGTCSYVRNRTDTRLESGPSFMHVRVQLG